MRHLRIAIRLLLRQPLFAATAIVSIAVGIGANTAIFTAVNQLLLARRGGVAGARKCGKGTGKRVSTVLT